MNPLVASVWLRQCTATATAQKLNQNENLIVEGFAGEGRKGVVAVEVLDRGETTVVEMYIPNKQFSSTERIQKETPLRHASENDTIKAFFNPLRFMLLLKASLQYNGIIMHFT
ncbi:hypothetical protein VNO78_02709 [Psophocarpus tetragonolobus]|uniref:Uncharacterized protein n=1 Tax=Psophocarpus tetragonolobus TaxID=3891 RepID=A0AAN9SZB5_PSOTE